ncbi:MAG TPA: 30S ribosome-binding factor RbfA [Clostridiaceae bacterium]|nr:30S ribosome-binding factor RbfA [Clostridiaceae bacterium]
MVDRINRISEEIKKIISDIILTELKDPRLPQLVSITGVDVTKDLKYAKVYVSVLGSDEVKKNAIDALKSASGYIRREIGHRMKIRYIPEIIFKLDNSIEHGDYIFRLIDKTMKGSEE